MHPGPLGGSSVQMSRVRAEASIPSGSSTAHVPLVLLLSVNLANRTRPIAMIVTATVAIAGARRLRAAGRSRVPHCHARGCLQRVDCSLTCPTHHAPHLTRNL